MAEAATAETRTFQAEVSRLLDIVAHSLYSDKEIFLRELISNASDACDRLRYAAITKPELAQGDGEYKIEIALDKTQRTLTVSDNGIGMSRSELVDNLGTIARSGTSAFLSQLSGDAKKDVALIGQFGVGFYSSFMVADKVEVLSLKAGETEAHHWSSDGKGEFTVNPAEKSARGTAVVLHLKAEESEFLEPQRLRDIVKRYSDHIQVPIQLTDGGKPETLNAASALWTRPKSEITEQQYKEFYRHAAHAFDQPWLTIHHKAEGTIEYTSLLYVPESKPFDLFHPDRRHHVKLYLKRVFITDDCKDLVPTWLRFLKGVVDTPDLPLNISRELLQKSPLLAKIRAGITKRVLSELAKQADADKDSYAKFWENFGAVLKEGLYEDRGENRETLLKLCRFRSTHGPELTSLADYVGRLKDGQEAIFTISGEELEALRSSPQLEGFNAKGVEVLLLTDPIDEFWISTITEFEKKPFKSVTRGGADLGKINAADKPDDKPAEAELGQVGALIAMFKLALGEAVKDVRKSERLTDSAVCLVADEHDLDMRLERMLRQHKQLEAGFKRILEVNPKHRLVVKLAEMANQKGAQPVIEDAAKLLLDQARIVEGEPVTDPKGFAKRLSDMMQRGLAA